MSHLEAITSLSRERVPAIHLATALRHGVSYFGTYDNRQGEAAEALGLKLVGPERS